MGGNLERAKEVIKELVRQGHDNVWVRRVVTRHNKDEHFYSSVRDSFGGRVHISQHYCFDRNEQEANETNEVIEGSGYLGMEAKRTYCGYPSRRIVVSSTGLCYPCCIDLHQEMPVGDINKESLEEIWNGEKMQTLREELKVNRFSSEACKNCQSWMSRQAPQRNFVQDVEVIA